MFYCIYRITNKLNGKTYIGQHKYNDLGDNYLGSGILLDRAKKKYGKKNFIKEILYSRIRDKSTADSMEMFAIKKERALGKAEYNIADGGQGGNLGEEVIRKIVESRKGYRHSDNTKRKISEAKKGSTPSNKGIPMSDEQKKKISERNKGNKYCLGRVLSEETKRKISENGKGKHNNLKGISKSEEHRLNLSKAFLGRHWYNNGEVQVQTFECPEGFVKGRLKRGDK